MTSEEAQRFLHEAAMCRDMAERSDKLAMRREWALLAEGYVRLAEAAASIETSALLAARGSEP